MLDKDSKSLQAQTLSESNSGEQAAVVVTELIWLNLVVLVVMQKVS
jgi:hypothetical protein